MTVVLDFAADVERITAGWSQEQRDAFAMQVQAEAVRNRSLLLECAGPLALACALNPRTVRTPALELVSAELEHATATPGDRVMISVSPQEGKALDTATPILTTAGWSTMGEVRVGDEVFHPDGHPTAVTEAHPVRHDRPCYRVTTTDGRSVVVDGEHLWTVQDRSRRGSAGQPALRETVTTDELLARGLLTENGRRANGSPHRAYRFKLPQQHEIVAKPVGLPIDPYLLGVWLGDGTSTSAQLTVGDLDLDETLALVEATGARIVSKRRDHTAWTVRFSTGGLFAGFGALARKLGVWGNKHVPDTYLAAGTEQRLALLQGLLDTDGSIFRTQTSSRVEFTACRRVLAEGVLYLARSLGWRATMRESAARLNGHEVGSRWRVCFTPEQGGHVPFRLRRKADRVQVSQSRAGELHVVSIACIEPVESRPVRCIRVEREDGLFLAGRDLIATHNTTLVRNAVIRALQRRPGSRNVIASYALDLARTSGRAIRGTIDQFGTGARDPGSALPLPDRLGIQVSADHAAAADWTLRGSGGGLYCVGVGGGLTGRPIDGTLFVDDPVKGRAEADSAAFQTATREWWQAVSETRLAPEASVVIVMTRWSEHDLVGWLLDGDTADEWRVVNIPALADGQTEDALHRPVGEWMVSARGRTPADWEQKRKRVGETTFASLYQGRPAPLAGGVFKPAWFDTWRVDHAPPGCLPPTVVVDPADNEGDGDEAGIIVATTHPESGKVYLLDDLSAPMTVARWARVALLTCARREAPSLAYEKSLSQLPRRIREAWAGLRQQAVALHRAKGDEVAALARLSRADDSAEAREQTAAALAEIAGDVEKVLAIPESGPRLRPIVARGSKQLRMQLAAPMFETGRAVIVGRLAVFEHQAAVWSPGQDSPDRVDAGVHAVQLLAGGAVTSLGRSDERVPTRSTGSRPGPGGAQRIARSVRR